MICIKTKESLMGSTDEKTLLPGGQTMRMIGLGICRELRLA